MIYVGVATSAPVVFPRVIKQVIVTCINEMAFAIFLQRGVMPPYNEFINCISLWGSNIILGEETNLVSFLERRQGAGVLLFKFVNFIPKREDFVSNWT